MSLSAIYGIEKSSAKTELLTILYIIEEVSSPTSNNPQRAILRLSKKPNTVRRFPFFVGCDRIKPKMKIGAIIIATPMKGIILLALEDMNMPNPRTNHKTDSVLCFIILGILMYFVKCSIPYSKLFKCFLTAPTTSSHFHSSLL